MAVEINVDLKHSFEISESKADEIVLSQYDAVECAYDVYS
jgi:hypothetical protein